MSADSIEPIVKDSTAALVDSGNASGAAVKDLTKAYQEMGAKNSKNLVAALKAMSAVKSPQEFIELQQKLISDGVQSAVADSQTIANLTAAVFTAAFEPMKKQFDSMQKPTHT